VASLEILSIFALIIVLPVECCIKSEVLLTGAAVWSSVRRRRR